MPKYSKQEQTEAIERLREWLAPGDKVHCILRHVSSSGMARVIQFVKMVDGNPRYLGRSIAIALGMSYDMKREGIKVEGCGMDMGFQVVYHAGRVLFPDGFGVEGTRNGAALARAETRGHAKLLVNHGWKFYGRNGDSSGWDNDGGYALQSVWL